MPAKDLARRLGPDEFAFRFVTEEGVDAVELGVFLQRAATVARAQGAELQVTAIEAGTVSVVLKALRAAKSRAQREFNRAPLAATDAALGLAGKVVAGIVAAA